MRRLQAKEDAGRVRAEGDAEGTVEEIVQTEAEAMTKAGMVKMVHRRHRGNLPGGALVLKNVAIFRQGDVARQDVVTMEGRGMTNVMMPNLSMRILLKSKLKTK